MAVIDLIKNAYPEISSVSPREMGALQLAYVGDTVYDLFVRTYLIHASRGTAHKLHLMATDYVRASAQARAFLRLEPMLTEEELSVYHRGRNAHSGTVPKNATVQDYRMATGLEALVGYLYLSGRDERLSEIMKTALETDTEELENE